jgi:hypothetical protein
MLFGHVDNNQELVRVSGPFCTAVGLELSASGTSEI